MPGHQIAIEGLGDHGGRAMVETLLAGSRGKRLEFRYYKWTEKVSFWVILGEDCVESFNSLKDAVEKYNEF